MKTMEKIYPPYDPAIVIVLTDNDVVTPSLATVTKWLLIVGTATIASDAVGNSGVFTVGAVTAAEAARVDGISEADPKLTINLSGQTILDGLYDAYLISFDPDHLSGFMWDTIPIQVTNLAEEES